MTVSPRTQTQLMRTEATGLQEPYTLQLDAPLSSRQGTVLRATNASGEQFIAKQYQGSSRLPDGKETWDSIIDETNAGRREIAILRKAERAGIAHVPRVVATGEGSFGVPVLVMTQLPGESLEALIHKQHVFSNTERDAIISSASHTLQQFHDVAAKPVLHRDVNWNNVLYDSAKQQTSIVDWGHAAATNGTISGTVVATRLFAAPELMRGEPGSRATDVYGLARTGMAVALGKRFVDLDGVINANDFAGTNLTRAQVQALLRGAHESQSSRPQTMQEFLREYRGERMAPVVTGATVPMPKIVPSDVRSGKVNQLREELSRTVQHHRRDEYANFLASNPTPAQFFSVYNFDFPPPVDLAAEYIVAKAKEQGGIYQRLLNGETFVSITTNFREDFVRNNRVWLSRKVAMPQCPDLDGIIDTVVHNNSRVDKISTVMSVCFGIGSIPYYVYGGPWNAAEAITLGVIVKALGLLSARQSFVDKLDRVAGSEPYRIDSKFASCISRARELAQQQSLEPLVNEAESSLPNAVYIH